MPQHNNKKIQENKKSFKESQLRWFKMGEWKVLLALAYGGPNNMYQISKNYEIQYPTVHRGIENLKEVGWIEEVEKRVSEKNIPTRIYGLTREGLLWLFSRIPKTLHPSLAFAEDDSLGLRETLNRKNVGKIADLEYQKDVYLHLLFEFHAEQIAKNNQNLFPLVFENWDLYKHIQIEQDITDTFPEAAFSTLVEYNQRHEELKPDDLSLLFAEKLYRNLLERYGLGYANVDDEYKEELLRKIKSALTNNQKSRELFDKTTFQIKNELATRLEFIEVLRTELGVARR
jgi:hypothetical protein